MDEDITFFIAVLIFAVIFLSIVCHDENKKKETEQAAFNVGMCPIVVTVPCGREACKYEGVTECEKIKIKIKNGAWPKL